MSFQKILPWVLIVYIAFVFLQSLVFKFTGSVETEIIFNTISDWMAGVGALSWAAEAFRSAGGWAVGLTELVAVVLLFIPRTRVWGALLALAVMSGAIFFHLGTPLGVDRVVDAAGNTDGGILFYMACGVWVAAAITLYLNRHQLGAAPAAA